jgi:hypothetical protein
MPPPFPASYPDSKAALPILPFEERLKQLEEQMLSLVAERDAYKYYSFSFLVLTMNLNFLPDYRSKYYQMMGTTTSLNNMKSMPTHPALKRPHTPQIDPAHFTAQAMHTSMPQPAPQTHPHIKFWTRADCKGWCDRPENQITKSRGSIPFLELENGDPVDESTAEEIHSAMRAAWEELDLKGIVPRSWGHASTSAKTIFAHIMEVAHPVFTYSQNGWKLKYLASIIYPGFAHRQRQHTVKKEQVDEPPASTKPASEQEGPSRHHDRDEKLPQSQKRKNKEVHSAQTDPSQPPSKKRKGTFHFLLSDISNVCYSFQGHSHCGRLGNAAAGQCIPSRACAHFG